MVCTPTGSQGNKAQGIGAQFGTDGGGSARNQIEVLPDGQLRVSRRTHTI